MKRFLAFIFLLVFLIVSPLALSAHALRSTLLDVETVKTQLRDANAYQRTIDAALIELRSEPVLSEGEIPFFSQDEIISTVQDIFTPTWLREQTEQTLDNIFIWLTTTQDVRDVEIVISLGDIKEHLRSILTTEVADRVGSLPSCTADQATLGTPFELATSGLCLAAGTTTETLTSDPAFTDMLDVIPLEIDLIDAIATGEGSDRAQETFTTLNNARNRLTQLQEGLGTLLVILLMVLLLIGALTASTAKSFFGWIGISLLLAGILTVIGPLLLYDRYGDILLQRVADTGWSAVAQDLVRDLVKRMGTEVLGSIRTYGIVLSSLGAAILLISIFIPKKKEKESGHSKKKGTHIELPKPPTLQEKFLR